MNNTNGTASSSCFCCRLNSMSQCQGGRVLGPHAWINCALNPEASVWPAMLQHQDTSNSTNMMEMMTTKEHFTVGNHWCLFLKLIRRCSPSIIAKSLFSTEASNARRFQYRSVLITVSIYLDWLPTFIFFSLRSSHVTLVPAQQQYLSRTGIVIPKVGIITTKSLLQL